MLHAEEQQGRVPQLLSPSALEPVPRNKRSRHSEMPAHATESGPRLPQLEKACRQQRSPSAPQNQENSLKKKHGFQEFWAWRNLYPITSPQLRHHPSTAELNRTAVNHGIFVQHFATHTAQSHSLSSLVLEESCGEK